MRRFFHAHAHSCVEIKFYAIAIPHRSTEPARPGHHREMT
jgi:hypothetical protein